LLFGATSTPPPPPPVLVIVEKIDGDPSAVTPFAAAPPAPTVTGILPPE
jgi:hypothetical protein